MHGLIVAATVGHIAVALASPSDGSDLHIEVTRTTINMDEGLPECCGGKTCPREIRGHIDTPV